MNEKIKGFSKSAGNVGKKVAKTTGKAAVKTAKFTGKQAATIGVAVGKEIMREVTGRANTVKSQKEEYTNYSDERLFNIYESSNNQLDRNVAGQVLKQRGKL